MKFVITILITIQLAFAFAKTDPLVLELKRKSVARKPQKKIAKTTKMAKGKSLKKTAVKDKYKDIFSNVEYGNSKSSDSEENDFMKDLSDAGDLDKSEKLEDFAAIRKENRKERLANKKVLRAKRVAVQKADPQEETPEMKVFANSISTVSTAKPEPDPTPTVTSTPVSKSAPIVVEKESGVSSWSVQPLVGYSLFMIDGPSEDPTRRAAQGYEYFEGYSAGLLADIGSGRLRLETGLVYLRAGAKREVLDFSLLGVGEDYIEYRDRSYIALPIMALYYFNEPSQSALFGKAGIWPAYLTSGRLEQYGTTSTKTLDNTAEYSRMDFLGTIGLGGKLKLGSNASLVVEGLFMRGFKQIYEVDYASGYNQGFLTTFSLNFEI
ncbi:MAG: porin family protein [Pseudomonadota bacterium]|nr:porin family protein [Pseudomonadota bacterium]